MNRREAMSLELKALSDSQRRALKEIAGALSSALEDLNAVPRSSIDPQSDVEPLRTSQIFFVSGEPGSGKTTVYKTLKHLLPRSNERDSSDQLDPDDRLRLRELVGDAPALASRLRWLEPLDLEPIAESTNFLAAVLVRIEAAVGGIKRDQVTPDRRPDLLGNRDALQDLRRLESDVVLAWEGTVPQRAERVDPEVFSQDVLRAEKARLEVNRRLRKVLMSLSGGAGTQDYLYVLPVDDFYLRPASSLEFLRLLRMISVPQLFILVMGDLDVVEELFYQDMLGQLVRLAGEHTFRSADQASQLTARAAALTSHALRKLIPLSQRSVLETMDQLQALTFSPKETRTNETTLDELLNSIPLKLDPAHFSDSPGTHLHPLTLKDFLLLRTRQEEADDARTYAGAYTYSGLAILDLPPREVVDLWQTLADFGRFHPGRGPENALTEIEWEDVLNMIVGHTLAVLQAETYLDVPSKKRCEEAIRGTPYYKRTFNTDALTIQPTIDERHAVSVEGGRTVTATRHVSWIFRPKKPGRSKDGRRRSKDGQRYKHSATGRIDYLSPRSTAWFTVLHDLMALSRGHMEEGKSLTSPLIVKWVIVSRDVVPGDGSPKYWPTPAWPSFRHFDLLAFRWNKIVDAMEKIPDWTSEAQVGWLAYKWLGAITDILMGRWDPASENDPEEISVDQWHAISDDSLSWSVPFWAHLGSQPQ